MRIDYNKNTLDVFRLIATVQVFLGHVITQFYMQNPPVNLIYFVRGVPILFALCGFLAAKSLEGRRVKEWWIGRAARIVPGLWACIILNTIIIALVYETKPTFIEGATYAVTQFFGLNFYTGDWLRGYGVGTPNGVLWTISVQIQFFALAPLIQKLLAKRKLQVGLITVGLLTLASIACNMAEPYLPEMANKLIGVTVVPYLYFLVAGMVVWYHRDAIIPALKKAKWFILVAYVAWKLMENHLAFPHTVDGILYNTVTTLLMCAVIFAFSFLGSWRMRRDYTFGFYLYHMVFVNLVYHFGFATLVPLWKGALTVLGVSVVTLLCAVLSKRFVEDPAARLLTKRGRKNG